MTGKPGSTCQPSRVFVADVTEAIRYGGAQCVSKTSRASFAPWLLGFSCMDFS